MNAVVQQQHVDLDNYPLARRYRWHPPIEDTNKPRFAPLVPPSVVRNHVVLRTPVASVVKRIEPAVVQRVANVGGRGRRIYLQTEEQRTALVKDYVELLKLPFRRGQFKKMCARHKIPHSNACMFLRMKGIFVDRRGKAKQWLEEKKRQAVNSLDMEAR